MCSKHALWKSFLSFNVHCVWVSTYFNYNGKKGNSQRKRAYAIKFHSMHWTNKAITRKYLLCVMQTSRIISRFIIEDGKYEWMEKCLSSAESQWAFVHFGRSEQSLSSNLNETKFYFVLTASVSLIKSNRTPESTILQNRFVYKWRNKRWRLCCCRSTHCKHLKFYLKNPSWKSSGRLFISILNGWAVEHSCTWSKGSTNNRCVVSGHGQRIVCF